MEVSCHLFGPLRTAAGGKTIERSVEPGTTVRELLDGIATETPALRDQLFEGGTLNDSLTITINRIHLKHDGGPERELADGDVVRLSPPFVGG